MNSIRSFGDVVGEGHVLQVVDASLRVAADDAGQHIASLDPGLLGGAAKAQPVTVEDFEAPSDGPHPPLSPEVLAALRAQPPGGTLMMGKGCMQTGYRGRVGTYEVLPMDRDMRELLRQKVPMEQLREATKARGFMTLFENGLRLCGKGHNTTPYEVQRVLATES